jgi:hypothetical protein
MTDNIDVFTQSSIRINDGGKVIYVDPFKMVGEPRNADYIFITHDHYDHFSPEDIEKVACSDTVLVVPEKMAGVYILQETPTKRRRIRLSSATSPLYLSAERILWMQRKPPNLSIRSAQRWQYLHIMAA